MKNKKKMSHGCKHCPDGDQSKAICPFGGDMYDGPRKYIRCALRPVIASNTFGRARQPVTPLSAAEIIADRKRFLAQPPDEYGLSPVDVRHRKSV